jgi:3-oxoacyl-[acyl-carrier protein] reductase
MSQSNIGSGDGHSSPVTSRELAGQVALVTGAGRNIGRAIALELAAQGASVGVNVRSNEQEALGVVRAIEELGGQAVSVVGDIGDAEGVERVVRHTRNSLGPITLLICNAGLRATKSALDCTVDEWQKLIDVNLSSTFHFIRSVVEDMKKADFGRIISITGGIAHYPTPGAHDNHAHLAATKAASEVLLRSLAPDLAKYGITCNAIAPGPIATERRTPVRLPSTAAGRPGTTGDIAYLCRVLCSPRASFVTGQVILADGGGMT